MPDPQGAADPDFPDDPFSAPPATSATSKAQSAQRSDLTPAGLFQEQQQLLATWAKDTRFSVLNSFSHVTSAARSGAHALLSNPALARTVQQQQQQYDAEQHQHGRLNHRAPSASPPHHPREQRNPSISSRLAHALTTFAQHGPVGPLGPADPGWKHSRLAHEIGGEFDSARVFLARFARQVAEEGERNRRRGGDGGAEADGTVTDEETGNLGAFEILHLHPSIKKPRTSRILVPVDEHPQSSSSPSSSALGAPARRRVGVTAEEWEGFFHPTTGEPIISLPELRHLVFSRGFESDERVGEEGQRHGTQRGRGSGGTGTGTAPSAFGPRCEAWCALLGASRWQKGVGHAERAQDWARQAETYWRLKAAWAGPRRVFRDRLGDGLGALAAMRIDPADSKPGHAGEKEEEGEEWEQQERDAAEERKTPFMRDQWHRIVVDCLRTDRKIPLFSSGAASASDASGAPKGGQAAAPSSEAQEGSVTAGGDGTEEGEGEGEQGARNANSSLFDLDLDHERSAGHGRSRMANRHVRALAEILLTYVRWDVGGGWSQDDPSRDGPSPEDERSGAAKDGRPHTPVEPTADEDSKEGTTSPREARVSLGSYVQGMSDLCAPLYVMCGADEVRTFWCFVGLMERMRSNFFSDQSGMRRQLSLLQRLISVMDPALYAHFERTDSLNLFFCFRWLLVLFKREFNFQDTLTLWEGIWSAEPNPPTSARHRTPRRSDVQGTSSPNSHEEKRNDRAEPTPPGLDDETLVDKDKANNDDEMPLVGEQRRGLCPQFQLFVALAILEQHREPMLRYLANFDEVLQYCHGLSHHIDVEETLAHAEVLCLTLRALVEQREAAERAESRGRGGGPNSPSARREARGPPSSPSLPPPVDAPPLAALPEVDEELRALVAGF